MPTEYAWPEKMFSKLDKSRMETQLMPEFVFLKEVTDSQVDDIVNLYLSEGWWHPGKDAPELVRRIVRGSHCFLAVIESGKVIGMGRAISDGYSDAYIQDVTVTAEYRGRKIGSEIINALYKRLHDDEIRWVGLIAEKNSSAFYEKLGFAKLENDIPMLRLG